MQFRIQNSYNRRRATLQVASKREGKYCTAATDSKQVLRKVKYQRGAVRYRCQRSGRLFSRAHRLTLHRSWRCHRRCCQVGRHHAGRRNRFCLTLACSPVRSAGWSGTFANGGDGDGGGGGPRRTVLTEGRQTRGARALLAQGDAAVLVQNMLCQVARCAKLAVGAAVAAQVARCGPPRHEEKVLDGLRENTSVSAVGVRDGALCR